MTRPMEMICVINPSQFHNKNVYSVRLRYDSAALVITTGITEKSCQDIEVLKMLDLEDPNISCWRAAGVGDDLLYKESMQNTGRAKQVSIENNHIALLKLNA